jgi:hypothetical protein
MTQDQQRQQQMWIANSSLRVQKKKPLVERKNANGP